QVAGNSQDRSARKTEGSGSDGKAGETFEQVLHSVIGID
ncbi:MAG: hypothetical protein ACI9HK_003650, partial [Pirellulaceae bacterium]